MAKWVKVHSGHLHPIFYRFFDSNPSKTNLRWPNFNLEKNYKFTNLSTWFSQNNKNGYSLSDATIWKMCRTSLLKPVCLFTTLFAYTAKTIHNSIKNTDDSFQFSFIFEVKTLQTFGSLKSNFKKHPFWYQIEQLNDITRASLFWWLVWKNAIFLQRQHFLNGDSDLIKVMLFWL